jgi:hypothetical protein
MRIWIRDQSPFSWSGIAPVQRSQRRRWRSSQNGIKNRQSRSKVRGEEIRFHRPRLSGSLSYPYYRLIPSRSPWKQNRPSLKADGIIRRNGKVKISEAFMGSYKTEKTFASTEGSYIEQRLWNAGRASRRRRSREGKSRCGPPQLFRGIS